MSDGKNDKLEIKNLLDKKIENLTEDEALELEWKGIYIECRLMNMSYKISYHGLIRGVHCECYILVLGNELLRDTLQRINKYYLDSSNKMMDKIVKVMKEIKG